MKCIIVTNNRSVLGLQNDYDDVNIIYAGENITSVTRRAIALAREKELRLLNDPMGGRLSRPIPYLSVMLGQADQYSAKIYDQLIVYEDLDNLRRGTYLSHSKRILEDFSELDKSLIETALSRVIKTY